MPRMFNFLARVLVEADRLHAVQVAVDCRSLHVSSVVSLLIRD